MSTCVDFIKTACVFHVLVSLARDEHFTQGLKTCVGGFISLSKSVVPVESEEYFGFTNRHKSD